MVDIRDLVSLQGTYNIPLNQYFPSVFAIVNPVSTVTFPTKHSYVVMEVVMGNGRKIFGPPLNMNIVERPPYSCEIFVNRLPAYLDDIGLLQSFHRLGLVYEMRLMMKSLTATRGYAFVRFVKESDALAAWKLFNFLFVNGNRLNVCRSIGKNRLFIGGIPKRVSPQSILAGFRREFPQMEHCNIFPALMPELQSAGIVDSDDIATGNRGYAFITFPDHDAALNAKRIFNTERRTMWGSCLSVKWAKSREQDRTGRAFYSELHNFSRIDERNCYDYSMILRLYCLANNWCVPIVVYGGNMKARGVQYGGILLKTIATNESCFILFEVAVANIYDIHLLMCEVASKIISSICAFPSYHYIVRVKHYTRAEIVHRYTSNTYLSEAPIYHYFVEMKFIYDLNQAFQTLADYSSEDIIMYYKQAFMTPSNFELPLLSVIGQNYTITFYAIHPKYRNNKPLANNFNDTEITLLLQETITNKYPIIDFQSPNTFYYATHQLCVQYADLHPGYTLKYVDLSYGKWIFYHPCMQDAVHPIVINGHSYGESIFERPCEIIESRGNTPN